MSPAMLAFRGFFLANWLAYWAEQFMLIGEVDILNELWHDTHLG